MKAAIIVLSDPKSGNDEALGRLFNALAMAFDYQQNGDEVTVLFQGAGTRWIAELTKTDHPAYALFDTIKQNVAGVSCACADVFGATEDIKQSPYDFITDNAVPGTTGLPSLHKLAADGYSLVVF